MQGDQQQPAHRGHGDRRRVGDAALHQDQSEWRARAALGASARVLIVVINVVVLIDELVVRGDRQSAHGPRRDDDERL